MVHLNSEKFFSRSEGNDRTKEIIFAQCSIHTPRGQRAFYNTLRVPGSSRVIERTVSTRSSKTNGVVLTSRSVRKEIRVRTLDQTWFMNCGKKPSVLAPESLRVGEGVGMSRCCLNMASKVFISGRLLEKRPFSEKNRVMGSFWGCWATSGSDGCVCDRGCGGGL